MPWLTGRRSVKAGDEGGGDGIAIARVDGGGVLFKRQRARRIEWRGEDEVDTHPSIMRQIKRWLRETPTTDRPSVGL